MSQQLPDDIVAWLLVKPERVEGLRREMHAEAAHAKWKAEHDEKMKHAKMVPCGMYGCDTPRNEYHIMCTDCIQEMKDDPDAFK
jgi:hypothetical protein